MKVYLLPYVAGMWRSMSPLYDEHKAAGDDVHVMPIPYYGRDHAGALANYHYDGYSFPVPVVDYRNVELNVERPDRIYFHNPYDDHNTVTSVNPIYYSCELKKATSELVYVPYYTRGFGADLPSAVSAPGVKNADMIVTWTPEQKEAYEKTGKPVVLKEYPSIRKKKANPPAEWTDRIKGRKVILFNNSLGSLIDRPGEQIDMVGDVIDKFIDDPNRCLLWRPHPLYVDTINALFPELGDKYMETMLRFANWGDGIIDTSWDLDTAAIVADEYLGNPSSVVELFRDLGKPVTII